MKPSGFTGLLELCGMCGAGLGMAFNDTADALVFDGALVTATNHPNYLEFDDKVGIFQEAGYGVDYNHSVFEGAS